MNGQKALRMIPIKKSSISDARGFMTMMELRTRTISWLEGQNKIARVVTEGPLDEDDLVPRVFWNSRPPCKSYESRTEDVGVECCWKSSVYSSRKDSRGMKLR